MGEPSLEILERLKEIADFQIREGASWEQIAAKWEYKNAKSAHSSTAGKYPEDWRKIRLQVRDQYLGEVEGEALKTLNELMQDADARVRQSSAHSLLHHVRHHLGDKHEITLDTAEGYRRVVEEAERIRHEMVLKEQGDMATKE